MRLYACLLALIKMWYIVWWFRWRLNVKHVQFASRRRGIAFSLISAMPCYGAALLQISRFCQEIFSLRIFPVNKRLQNWFYAC